MREHIDHNLKTKITNQKNDINKLVEALKKTKAIGGGCTDVVIPQGLRILTVAAIQGTMTRGRLAYSHNESPLGMTR